MYYSVYILTSILPLRLCFHNGETLTSPTFHYPPPPDDNLRAQLTGIKRKNNPAGNSSFPTRLSAAFSVV